MTRRALLLSAYDAGSHRRWRRFIVEHVDAFDWTVATLPPRHFSWRYRGNALSWGLGDLPRGPFDLVLATSVTNLSALLGLRPDLHTARKVVYAHENQFVYPSRTRSSLDPHLALQEVLTASAADSVLFNSEWNRASFLRGADDFLSSMPDAVPAGVVAAIEAKSEVVPVPVEIAGPAERRTAREPLRIVWNHRWEHDKGPDDLLSVIRGLKRRGAAFELVLLGQRFRQIPDALEQLEAEFGDVLVQWGYVASRAAYVEHLRACDVVLSTAHHEFQGLAVLEAMMVGCKACVPDALAYPEYVPDDQRWPAGDIEAATEMLAEWCAEPTRLAKLTEPTLDRFRADSLAHAYRSALGAQRKLSS
jgi:glycosyltransferase involved in cell wall biosynthesis